MDTYIQTDEADLQQVKLSSRCSCTDEEVLGEEETLALSFLPQREGAQADFTEHPPLAAGRQLDERACSWRQTGVRGRWWNTMLFFLQQVLEKKLTLSDKSLTGV